MFTCLNLTKTGLTNFNILGQVMSLNSPRSRAQRIELAQRSKSLPRILMSRRQAARGPDVDVALAKAPAAVAVVVNVVVVEVIVVDEVELMLLRMDHAPPHLCRLLSRMPGVLHVLPTRLLLVLGLRL